MSLPIKSAVWSGEIGCGSNGTVQVKCSCKSNVVGDNCDQCVDGFYGFPNCKRRFLSSIFLIWTYFPLILQWKTILFFLQPVIVIKKDLTILNVTMKMDSAPASQTFLARSVKNVLRDCMDFQNAKVGFCYQYFWSKYISL